MTGRSCLGVPVILGVMVVPVAATHDTDVYLPVSGCRWDPTQNGVIETSSEEDRFWLRGEGGSGTADCPIPLHSGFDTAGHLWGTGSGSLASGEIRTDFLVFGAVEVRIIHMSHTGGLSYASCSSVSHPGGNGLEVTLFPTPCPTLDIMVLKVTVGASSEYSGAMINDAT